MPRETIEHCPACRTRTPHTRWIVPWALVLAGILALPGLWLVSHDGDLRVVGTLPLLAALVLVLRDRHTYRRIRCDRCRIKKRVEMHTWNEPWPRHIDLFFWL